MVLLLVLSLLPARAVAQTQPGGILCGVRGYVGDYTYAPDGYSWSIQMDGRTGYFLHHDDVSDNTELVVVDFTVPLAPMVLGTYPIGNGAYELLLQDGVLYASLDQAGIGIFDVSDPSNITQVGLVGVDASNWISAVVGDRMYVADHSDRLRVVDIADPANPVVLSEMAIAGTPRRMVAEGERVYLAIDTDELLVIDVADSSSPALLEAYPYDSHWFPSLAMDSGLIVLAGSSQFQVIETNPGVYELVLRSETATYDIAPGIERISDLRLDGTDLVIGTSETGHLMRISLEDPAAPALIGYTGAVSYEAYDFALGSDQLVVLAGADPYGFSILDLNRAGTSVPFTEAWYAFSAVDDFDWIYSSASALEDGLLYTSLQTYDFFKEQGFNGVLVLDVQDPANPVPVGSYLTGDDVVDFLEVRDGIVYMNRYEDGLEIVDFTTPSNPVQLLQYNAFHDVQNLGIDGDTLWMQVERNEHVLLDISDPKNAVFKAFYKLDSNARSYAAYHDGLLYISHEMESGDDDTPVLSVVDLADPFRPVRVDYPTPAVFEEIHFAPYKLIGLSTETRTLYTTAISNLYDYDTAPLHADEGRELVVAGNYAYWNAWYNRVLVYDLRISNNPKLIGSRSPQLNEFIIVSDGEQMMLVSNDSTVGVTLDPSCEHCFIDLNYDDELNFFDVATFLAGYLNQDPSSDLTGDGAFNFHDISHFLSSFNAGCGG